MAAPVQLPTQAGSLWINPDHVVWFEAHPEGPPNFSLRTRVYLAGQPRPVTIDAPPDEVAMALSGLEPVGGWRLEEPD